MDEMETEIKITRGVKRKILAPTRKNIKKKRLESHTPTQSVITPVSLIFDKKKEIINVLNTSGDIVENLLGKKRLCSLIDSHVKVKKVFDGGASGSSVCIVTFSSGTEKTYVIKMIKEENQVYEADIQASLSYYADLFEKTGGIRSWFIKVNGGNENKMIIPRTIIQVPQYAIGCKTSKDEIFQRFDNEGVIKVPKGSYLCEDSKYSEYILYVLTAQLVEDGKCIHFCDTFGFSTCDALKHQGVTQYIFLEHIKGGDLFSNLKMLTKKKIAYKNSVYTFLDIIYVQILIAIASYQFAYKLQHNDLHLKNILLEPVENVTFLGEKLSDAKAFRYVLPFGEVYLPKISHIAKIMDFGLSVSYGDPIIGNKRMFTTAYKERNFGQYWYPNWYNPSYDVMMITYAIQQKDPSSTFISNILKFMTGDFSKNYFNSYGRPLLNQLHELNNIDAKTILHNKELMGDLLIKTEEASFLGVY